MPNISAKSKNDAEAVARIQATYQEFLKELGVEKKELLRLVEQISKRVSQEKIKEILQSL